MNQFFRKFKFKYQRYAIRNLPVYVSVMFALAYLLVSTYQGLSFYYRYLAFSPALVLRGQIWRIATAMIYPPVTGNVFYAILGIFIYYNFSSIIERSLGTFEFNIYFFGSVLIGEAVDLIYYLIFGDPTPFIPMFTHFAIFMAFAVLYSESTVLLFFIIPVKTKYIAVFELAIYTYYFILGNMYTKAAIIGAVIPVYLFYRMVSGGGGFISGIRDRIREEKRRREWRDQWK